MSEVRATTTASGGEGSVLGLGMKAAFGAVEQSSAWWPPITIERPDSARPLLPMQSMGEFSFSLPAAPPLAP
jgi:hypothetical protein